MVLAEKTSKQLVGREPQKGGPPDSPTPHDRGRISCHTPSGKKWSMGPPQDRRTITDPGRFIARTSTKPKGVGMLQGISAFLEANHPSVDPGCANWGDPQEAHRECRLPGGE